MNNPNRSRIAALVLAAGFSTRMGSLKPLLPLGSGTILDSSIRMFHRAGVEDVIVVVGHEAERIIPVVEARGARWMLNPSPEDGMLSSILTGLATLDSAVQAFFLLPGDIPLVRAGTLTSLLDCYREHPAAPVIYPFYNGERGHPPLISVAALGGLSAHQEGGMRGYLEKLDDDAVDLRVNDEGTLTDCDTPTDYGRVLDLHGSARRVPSRIECLTIWEQYSLPNPIRSHSLLVAEVARIMAVGLRERGHLLDLDLIVAAGLLHDLARDKRDHAHEGARLIQEMGFADVADIVAVHTDFPPGVGVLSEAALVYLADKLVEEDHLVSLEDRFGRSIEKCRNSEAVLRRIRERLQTARSILSQVERTLECPMEKVLKHCVQAADVAFVVKPRSVYLVRHGEIEIPGGVKRYIGQVDFPLSLRGAYQAERLRDSLRDLKLSAVYCSGLQRSIATASVIAEPHGLQPQLKQALREIDLGAWDGLSFQEVRENFPREYEARGLDIAHFKPEGGESFLDVACRVIPAFCHLIEGAEGDFAVVAHAGVNRVILSRLMGMPLDALMEIPQDYGCLNVIEAQTASLRIERFNGAPWR